MSTYSKIWLYRLLFSALLLLVSAMVMVPAPVFSLPVPRADIVFCFVAAWLARRPDYAPAWIIVTAILLAEFLAAQAPGLWSAVVLGVSEIIRSRHEKFRQRSFLYEWSFISAMFASAVLSYQLILMLAFLPTTSLRLILFHIAVTILIYPLTVLVTNYLFRVFKRGFDEQFLFPGLGSARKEG
ncbi:MAG: hypothetical protein OXF74_11740 [Rhodobacteraceae bacterium]|nr:hypothetical protein [Paracoccaceae bacterium]